MNKSGSIRCEVPDEQMGNIMKAIILPYSWMDRLLAKIQLADEVKRVNRERRKVETRLSCGSASTVPWTISLNKGLGG